MFYRTARRRPVKSTHKLQYCCWFLLFLIIGGLSLLLVTKYMDDGLKDKILNFHGHDSKEVPKTQQLRNGADSRTPPPGSSSEEDQSVVPNQGNSQISQRNIYGLKQEDVSFDTIHFIHIPKCGGTTMTAILRQMVCNIDPAKNADCCLNPGFCDWHAHRRCAMIKGCINHFPNRKLIYEDMPSMAVFREPTSRLISAFFYRGHSPNLDFFQVRPEFKDIKDGKRPRVTFQEYIEMPEYQNIFTRMLGADSFPYRNITVTDEVFAKAIDAVDHLYFIALQEDFDVSVKALSRLMHVPNASAISITKERGGDSKPVSEQKSALKSDPNLMTRVRELNHYDVKLFEHVVKRYCAIIQSFPDLYKLLTERNKVHC